MRRDIAEKPEFLLLTSCCRWNFRGSELPRPEHPNGLNWDKLVMLARRHRVQGLVWNALAQQADQLPATAIEALSSDARSIAAANLAMAAECREIRLLFEQAKIPLMFVKGLTVGALAYRSPLLKMGWDIDLLIDPADLDVAAGLLAKRGYVLRLPSSPALLQSWHKRSKESVWHKDESLYLELHTHLADNRRLIPAIDVHSPGRQVEIAPTLFLPTLTEEELISYLAVHGASSAWFRLKWISDFAALLSGRSGEEIERLYRKSQELGAARAAGQAMLLADRLFGVLHAAPELRERLESDRAIGRLCRAAMRMIEMDCEPTERRFGTLAIHSSQFLLKSDLGFKFSELGRQGVALLRP